jgi:hypothetical protein
MNKVNYKQIFARKAEAEKRLRLICPEAAVHQSGIYFYTREDLEGKHAYIGKAIDLCERTVSHMTGYEQRIDISIKPTHRGFYSKYNPSGWKLSVLYYPKDELDQWEQHWIARYRSSGVDLYNVESGGTDGKTIIGERKSPKSYRDGLAQGRKNLAKELRHIIDTHHFEICPAKDNKITQKALEKFWELLEIEDKE